MNMITVEMTKREAILARDAIKWYVEEQQQRRKKLPKDYDQSMISLAEQFDSERLDVAERIDEGIAMSSAEISVHG